MLSLVLMANKCRINPSPEAGTYFFYPSYPKALFPVTFITALSTAGLPVCPFTYSKSYIYIYKHHNVALPNYCKN